METGCAFMNSIGGGHLLFGISDSGTIIGQEVSDKTRKEIAGTLNKFEPTTFVETQYIEVPNTNRFVIALHFQDVANRKPYCFDGRAYIKIESTTSVMPQEAYNELLMSRKKEQFHWELLTNKKITEDLLDRDRIIGTIRLGIEHGRLPESAMEVMDIPILLNKLDLIEDEGFKNACAILFLKKTNGLYPQCKLRLARFKGVNRSAFIDNAQIEGNVFELFDAAMTFLFKHLSLSGKVIHAEREEELTVPYKALRESIINALCHRDYARYNGSMGIAIYDDRVEIINTGSLPKEINARDLSHPHKSIPTNPLIANVFYRRKMVESWGRGLDLMFSECNRVHLPAPIILDNNGEVVVTFFFSEQVTEQVIRLLEVIGLKEMSIKEILTALELKHRPTLLYDYVQPAMEKGLVEQTQPESPNSPFQKYRLTKKGKNMKENTCQNKH